MALTWLTPPGRKRSKGNWALVGARGVFPFLSRRFQFEYMATSIYITPAEGSSGKTIIALGILDALQGTEVLGGAR